MLLHLVLVVDAAFVSAEQQPSSKVVPSTYGFYFGKVTMALRTLATDAVVTLSLTLEVDLHLGLIPDPELLRQGLRIHPSFGGRGEDHVPDEVQSVDDLAEERT